MTERTDKEKSDTNAKLFLMSLLGCSVASGVAAGSVAVGVAVVCGFSCAVFIIDEAVNDLRKQR